MSVRQSKKKCVKKEYYAKAAFEPIPDSCWMGMVSYIKVWQTAVIFFNDDTIISIDEYLSDNHTRDKANDYPTDIGNYFVNKDRMDAIPIIKKKRTIIVIVEE